MKCLNLHLVYFAIILFAAGCQQTVEEENPFSPCVVTETYPEHFQVGTAYEGGIFALRRYFQTNFKACDNCEPLSSGFVGARFMVDCHGEAGDFKLEIFNQDFEEQLLHDQIVEQIVPLLKAMPAWTPGKDSLGEHIDSFAHLLLKFEGGRLVDLTQ